MKITNIYFSETLCYLVRGFWFKYINNMYFFKTVTSELHQNECPMENNIFVFYPWTQCPSEWAHWSGLSLCSLAPVSASTVPMVELATDNHCNNFRAPRKPEIKQRAHWDTIKCRYKHTGNAYLFHCRTLSRLCYLQFRYPFIYCSEFWLKITVVETRCRQRCKNVLLYTVSLHFRLP